MMRSKVKQACILLIFFIFAGPQLSVAQSRGENKGDRLVEIFQYDAAINAYLSAVKQNQDNERIMLKLARCYHLLNNPQGIVRWYRQVIENRQLVTPEDQLNYAMALMGIEKFEEAKKMFAGYNEEMPGNKMVTNYLATLEDFESLKVDSALYTLKPVAFNSSYSDFSPTYLNNQIVFVSSRDWEDGAYSLERSFFLDVYISSRNSLGIFDFGIPFHNDISTRYHDGPLQFYDNEKKLVLTRNDIKKGKLSDRTSGITNLNLYFYQINAEGGWSMGDPFPYNTDEFSIGHPAISENGDTLYFVSDMPGGHGSFDIYLTCKQANNWSKPKNVGFEINTNGDELFPFLYRDNILYFASNGHGGLGGLDVFEFDFKTGELKNMGVPINSSRDDFSLIINPESKEGFLASNRASYEGGGNDDIYQFEIVRPDLYSIFARVIDAQTDQPIGDVTITWEEFVDKSHSTLKTNSNGLVMIPVKLLRQYTLKANKKGYQDHVEYLIPKDGSENITLRLNPD